MRIEDTAAAILRILRSALGILHATTAAYPGYPRRVEISGTEGKPFHPRARPHHRANLRNAQPPRIRRLDENQSASSAAVTDFPATKRSSRFPARSHPKHRTPPAWPPKAAASIA